MRCTCLHIPDLLCVPMVPVLLSHPPMLPLARTDLSPLTRHPSNVSPASERKCHIAHSAGTRRLTSMRRTAVCSVAHTPYQPSLLTRLPPRTHLKYNYTRQLEITEPCVPAPAKDGCPAWIGPMNSSSSRPSPPQKSACLKPECHVPPRSLEILRRRA
jgi:hypothetical protein